MTMECLQPTMLHKFMKNPGPENGSAPYFRQIIFGVGYSLKLNLLLVCIRIYQYDLPAMVNP